jgi:hypothetical protein
MNAEKIWQWRVMNHNPRAIGFYEEMDFQREDGITEQSELAGVSFLEQRYIS